MNRLRVLTWAVVGLLVVNLALVAFLLVGGPPHPPGNGPRGEGPKDLIIAELDLTKEQTARYEQLIGQHQTAIGRLNGEIRQTKNKLYATLTTGDQTQEDFLISRLGVLQRQVETVHYNHFLDLKKLCRPAQYAKFNELTTKLADYFATGKRPPMHR